MAYTINMNETTMLNHAIDVAKANPSDRPDLMIKKVFEALREIAADGQKD